MQRAIMTAKLELKALEKERETAKGAVELARNTVLNYKTRLQIAQEDLTKILREASRVERDVKDTKEKLESLQQEHSILLAELGGTQPARNTEMQEK
jgi:uncharacterized protein (DUF3084 family)